MERRYSYDEGMVLRTVYLPKDLDERLRTMAHTARISKNELIRQLIGKGLDAREGSAEERFEEVQAQPARHVHTRVAAATAR